MTFRTSVSTVLLLALSTIAYAGDQSAPDVPPPPGIVGIPDQQPQPTPQPPTPKPGVRQTPTPPPGAPAGQPPPRKTRGRDLNLQIEITITDQSGTLAAEKKVVSMLVADSTMGRIRASADAQRQGLGMVGTGLNVDARPVILEGDRILLDLTVEYMPFREGGQITQRPTLLNESLSVILQNGKPIVVSQAADPVTDRRMTVEVRASIVK